MYVIDLIAIHDDDPMKIVLAKGCVEPCMHSDFFPAQNARRRSNAVIFAFFVERGEIFPNADGDFFLKKNAASGTHDVLTPEAATQPRRVTSELPASLQLHRSSIDNSARKAFHDDTKIHQTMLIAVR